MYNKYGDALWRYEKIGSVNAYHALGRASIRSKTVPGLARKRAEGQKQRELKAALREIEQL